MHRDLELSCSLRIAVAEVTLSPTSCINQADNTSLECAKVYSATNLSVFIVPMKFNNYYHTPTVQKPQHPRAKNGLQVCTGVSSAARAICLLHHG